MKKINYFQVAVNGTLEKGKRARLVLTNGDFVETSPVINFDYFTVETQNTIYRRKLPN